jgi:hypothetical protein
VMGEGRLAGNYLQRGYRNGITTDTTVAMILLARGLTLPSRCEENILRGVWDVLRVWQHHQHHEIGLGLVDQTLDGSAANRMQHGNNG